PWGDEAFAKAKAENKPILLSVGYSACHWCHVMERESFEDEAIAAIMNRNFVNVKVDREERPDVDQLYMTAVQLITRHGGWPMSVWLTPDLRPFYGGTYFPPNNFVAYLRALEDTFRNKKDEVDKTSEQIVTILERLAWPSAPESPLKVDAQLLDTLIDRSIADYDPKLGGFGSAPKFPRQTLLELLLAYLDGNGDQSQIAVRPGSPEPNRKSQIEPMLVRTLDAMADGGIRDQLGGGFHRYSTDAKWLVPHFEIMLYDNAMLGWIYAEAHRQTRKPRYAQVARGIFDFVLREMTSPHGGFYTAFDAEVDAQEGLSYLWTAEEIERVLGQEDAVLFNRVYGVDRGPNFADPHHGTGQPDKNILFLPQPLDEAARDVGLSPEQLDLRLAPLRQKLYEVREKRKQPLLDTKVITSWNAMMIRALAHGAKVLGEPRYLEAATRAANFLLQHHRSSDDGLYRTSRDGTPKHDGFVDDYAYFAQALLAIHDASGEAKWKHHAAGVAVPMLKRFVDSEAGGFYFTEAGAKDLIVRQKTAQDSPLPSGNAVAAMVLLGLDQVKGSMSTLGAFVQQMVDHCESMSSMVQASLLHLRKADPFTVSALPGSASSDRPSLQQVAAGVVSVKAEWHSAAELHLVLSILENFHINAHEAGGDIPLIATNLTTDVPGAAVEYPPGEETAFAFTKTPIRVYSGDVTLVVRFSPPPKPESQVRFILTYQACDDTSCFPPVTKQLEMEVPSLH
ncbi:MAG TPA: DUF255 domain-containing protein, partial [Tepidisphaeraceae bacterium]|nr:DUF255 domain-containing protein [Tepidisphaeraceae bacterium]